MNIFVVVVIVYCSIRINSAIKHVVQIANNKNAIEIHHQVMKVLIIQAFLPVIVIIVPLLFTIVFSLLRISFPMLGLYTLIMIMFAASIKVSATQSFCVEQFSRLRPF
jgi:hypothetical protein